MLVYYGSTKMFSKIKWQRTEEEKKKKKLKGNLKSFKLSEWSPRMTTKCFCIIIELFLKFINKNTI